MATVYLGTLMSRWELSEAEEILVQELTSARARNYFFDPRYKAGYWNGIVEHYNAKTKQLPAGLVPDTIAGLEARGYSVEVVTHPRVEPPLRENGKLNYSLDPHHQLRVLETMLENDRGIVWAATNSGKTKIAQAWCTLFQLKVLYLVPSKELLNQTVASFERDTNLDVGWISADEGWNVGKDVTVALVSSIVPRKRRGRRGYNNQKAIDRFREIAPDFEAVIADECHHATANGWSWVLQELKRARFRFGLSGSPWNRGDRATELAVKSWLGPVISRVENAELVERGWSAKPKIRMIEVNAGTLPKGLEDDWRDVFDAGVVENHHRNSLITRLAERLANAQKSCLIITTSLEHTAMLSDLLGAMRVDHRVLTGEVEGKARKSFLDDFRAQAFPVVISTVLGEGVDVPHLSGIILASAGRSQKQLLQRVGRGLRKKVQGPNQVEIYDFMDHVHPMLKRQAKDRLELYRSEGFEVEISTTLPAA